MYVKPDYVPGIHRCRCPYCGRWQYSDTCGMWECDSCRREFYGVEEDKPEDDTEQVAPADAYTLLPDVLLDDEGYPTTEWLQYIKSYKPDESLPLLTFVEMVLVDGWYMSDWGFKLHKKYKGKRKLELHTGGWSGNEETIAAIKSNMWLTHFQMRYVMWKTGGHYYFELSVS